MGHLNTQRTLENLSLYQQALLQSGNINAESKRMQCMLQVNISAMSSVSNPALQPALESGLTQYGTRREVLKFFVGKGRLRARVVSGGEICVGDQLTEDA